MQSGSQYSLFDSFYQEFANKFGFDASFNVDEAVELIVSAVKLRNDKMHLKDMIGETELRNQTENDIVSIISDIKHRKLSPNDMLAKKQGSTEIN